MTSADLAFVNGAVYTVDAARTRASAVAVEDGRIVAVGTDDEIRDQIGVADRGRRPPRTDARCPGSRTRTSTR